MKAFKRAGIVVINSVLLLVLVGLLVAYLSVVSDLPSRVYTMDQREFLAYNSSRSVAQSAPIWNIVKEDGVVAPIHLPGQDSRVRATLTARYEEQDRVSVTLYDLDFRGEYHLGYTGSISTTMELFFPFPSNLETLHEVRFLVDGEEPPDARYTTQGIGWGTMLQPGEAHEVEISYRADGASSFSYGLQHNQRSDVDVEVTVVGLTGSEVPQFSLPASATELAEGGEVWTWHYAGLIADRNIQLELPTRLSFAQRVALLQDDFRALARLAPLLVGGFLASLAGMLYLGNLRLRLASYLLAGCGFALFYPLLTFLSGLVDLVPAAVLALALVSGLVVVFIGLRAGWRHGAWRAVLLMVIYLGFFSLGTLTPWRGLLLTGGALVLIGAFMLLYARYRSTIAPEPEARPDPEPDAGLESSPEAGSEPVPDVQPASGPSEPEPGPEPQIGEGILPEQEPAGLHCPYCARSLDEDYQFCPACGHDTSQVRRCGDCGRQQFVPAELGTVYCVHCGASIPRFSEEGM
jgi:hypothetical protein